jgi:hypothetical protein
MKLDVPKIDGDQLRLGACLGSGLDKVCHQAVWAETGEVLPYVIKFQRPDREGYLEKPLVDDGQTGTELDCYRRLLNEELERAPELARATLSCLAAIVGYWRTDDGRLCILQEKVGVGSIDTDIFARKGGHLKSPVGACFDMSCSNYGRRCTGKLVVADWGIESYYGLLEMGQVAIETNQTEA